MRIKKGASRKTLIWQFAILVAILALIITPFAGYTRNTSAPTPTPSPTKTPALTPTAVSTSTVTSTAIPTENQTPTSPLPPIMPP